jgi:hypothetical protein
VLDVDDGRRGLVDAVVMRSLGRCVMTTAISARVMRPNLSA